MRNALRGLTGVVAFLLVWEVVGHSGLVPQSYFPPASTVLVRLVEILGQSSFLLDAIATLLAWVISLGLAVVIAVPLGLLFGSAPTVRLATGTIVEFLRPIPSVALIPLAILVLGTGPSSKIALAVFASVWPILLNTVYALGELDPQLSETARAYGVRGWRKALRVHLPGAAPFIATGVRVSAGIALIVLISTELLSGASGGIGYFIHNASGAEERMDVVLAAVIVAGVLGYLVNAGLEGVRRRWLDWGSQEEAT